MEGIVLRVRIGIKKKTEENEEEEIVEVKVRLGEN